MQILISFSSKFFQSLLVNFIMETTPFVPIMKDFGNFAQEILNFLVAEQRFFYSKLYAALIC